MAIGHHYSEESFKKYAPYIADALTQFPNVLRVEIEGSVETFAGRFRDARRAKKLYGYRDERIDEKLFALHADKLVVAMREGHCLVGPREALKAPGTLTAPSRAEPSQGEVIVTGSPERIGQLCELVALRIFSPMPVFILTGISPEQAQTLETTHGVTLIADKPGQFILL